MTVDTGLRVVLLQRLDRLGMMAWHRNGRQRIQGEKEIERQEIGQFEKGGQKIRK
jgi:hypothetical protein